MPNMSPQINSFTPAHNPKLLDEVRDVVRRNTLAPISDRLMSLAR
jgi:hypothetical protein